MAPAPAHAAAAYNSRQNSGNNLGVRHGRHPHLAHSHRPTAGRGSSAASTICSSMSKPPTGGSTRPTAGVTFEDMERNSLIRRGISTTRSSAPATIGPKDYNPFLGQYKEFKGERVAAMGNVLEAERNLRGPDGHTARRRTRVSYRSTSPLWPPISRVGKRRCKWPSCRSPNWRLPARTCARRNSPWFRKELSPARSALHRPLFAGWLRHPARRQRLLKRRRRHSPDRQRVPLAVPGRFQRLEPGALP